MSKISQNQEETEEIASSLVKRVLSLPSQEKAIVIALSGELGAGKTVFAKGIAKALGITETVSSPTFVIQKKYKIPQGLFKNLIHIDAYRLEKEKELEVIGWDDIVASPENLIVIEWPERVSFLIPPDAITVVLGHVDEGTRSISLSYE